MTIRKRLTYVSFAVFLFSEVVASETQPDQSIEDKGSSRLIEEVIVTSQKREENITDVAISLQAFSGEKLDAMGIFDQQDLQQITPTLNVSNIISFTSVFLRGIGTDAILTADPSIATYIDGIYFPFPVGMTQDFGVTERIEVLKGPQGTLFGRNANGGALNIVTKDPSFEAFEFQTQLTFATYPEFHGKIFANIPITDSFAMSASLIHSDTEHYMDYTVNGEKPGPDRESGARIKFFYTPHEDIDILLAVQYAKQDAPNSQVTPSRYATVLPRALGQPERPYPVECRCGELGNTTAKLRFELENEVIYGRVNYFTPWFDFRLLGSKQDITTNGYLDIDGTPASIMSFNTDGYGSVVDTAEIQFISNEEQSYSSWLKWIAGAYYFESFAGIDPMFGYVDAVDDSFGSLFGGVITLLDQLNIDANLLPSSEIYLYGTVTTESESAFLQTTVSLTDWFDITLGARYQVETRKMEKSGNSIVVRGEETEVTNNKTAMTQDGREVGPISETESVSPKVSLEFHPFEDEEVLAYVSYQEAVKSGTYNTVSFFSTATYAEPEYINAWELGAKASLFGGGVNLSSAIFRYEIENLQVQHVSLQSGGVVRFENAGLAEIQGMELDLTTVLFPGWFDNLILITSVGWLKEAEYIEYLNAAGSDDERGYSGNRMTKTPEYSGNITLSKTWDIGFGSFELTGDAYYMGDFYYDHSNDEESLSEAYTLVGARASVLHYKSNVRLTAFARNITDEAYTQGELFVVETGRLTNVAPPRTYGLRMSWEY